MIFRDLKVPITPQRCQETRGFRVDEVVAYWFARYPWNDFSREHASANMIATVTKLIEAKARPMAGALNVIKIAEKRTQYRTIASSSPRLLIESILRAFGIRDKFELVHSAEDETAGKPNPAIFLTIANKLRIPASRCIVFEDSVAGVIAAKAASMRCVAVPSPEQRYDPRFSIADVVLTSLADFDDATWSAVENNQ